jgi:hypothetical protein
VNKLGELLKAGAGTPEVVFNPTASAGSRPSFSQRGPVLDSPDLERVIALPRRTLSITAEEIEALHTRLRRPGSTMTLRPIQAMALKELSLSRGLLAQVVVGEGKTLIALLAGTVLGVKKTLLLVKPDLRKQLLRMHKDYSEHWRIPNLVPRSDIYYPDVEGELFPVAYSGLSTENQADALEKYQPELIVCDESHSLSRPESARSKRFWRFFELFPSTMVAFLSGTQVSKTIKDFAPHTVLALRELAPVPIDQRTTEEWSSALDPLPGGFRSPPGALARLCSPGEDVCDGFSRRLLSTQGVVSSADKSSVGATLVLHERKPPLSDNLRDALKRLAETWCLGDEELVDALAYYAASSQLACGFYYRRVWPRGEPQEVRDEWVEAQAEWNREVREQLKHSLVGMDSPGLCDRAAQRYWTLKDKYALKARRHTFDEFLKHLTRTRRKYWGSAKWRRWAAIRDQAKPDTEAVWLDDCVVDDAVAWGRKHVGLIWYEHAAFGARVAEVGGFPLYGGGEEASERILDERGDRTVVASIEAHRDGKNLQMFSRQLVTTPQSSGKISEQMLGRLHRPGQKADEVETWIYQHTPELRKALASAIADARFIQSVWKTPQKLVYANYTFTPPQGDRNYAQRTEDDDS